jgi:hypothetical protein
MKMLPSTTDIPWQVGSPFCLVEVRVIQGRIPTKGADEIESDFG